LKKYLENDMIFLKVNSTSSLQHISIHNGVLGIT